MLIDFCALVYSIVYNRLLKNICVYYPQFIKGNLKRETIHIFPLYHMTVQSLSISTCVFYVIIIEFLH